MVPSAASRPVEIKALSGARALPPLILVLYHFCEGHFYRDAKWFDVPVGKGYLWVEFFFALSGFILVHVYGDRAAEFWHGARTYLTFVKTRLALVLSNQRRTRRACAPSASCDRSIGIL